MSAIVDDFLDDIQTAAEGWLAGQDTPRDPPVWLRDSTDNAGGRDLSEVARRVLWTRKRAGYEPPVKVGGNQRARIARRMTIEAEVRGEDDEDFELLVDAIAWSLRLIAGTAYQSVSVEWLPREVGSRGLAGIFTFNTAFNVLDPATPTATVNTTSQTARLVPSLP